MKKTILIAALVAAMSGATAVAVGAGSGESPVVKVTQKAPVFSVDLPMEMAMTNEEFGYFTLIDGNGDGQKWRYQANGMTSPSNDKMDGDDWAITPGLRFVDVASNYELAFTIQQNMAGEAWQASFEFYIGTAPEVAAMTTLIGRIDGFHAAKKDTPYEKAIQFAVPGEAGTYYIGFRCVSPMMKDGVSPWPTTFKNISVKAMESSAAAPMQPADVAVVPGEQGALSATVSFTMPTTAMNGKPLPTSAELTATIVSPVETKTVKALPGAAVSQVIATAQGDNALSVTVDGEMEGEPVPLTVYTGVVLPMRVHDLAAVLSPDNMSMTLTWTPPTEGKNGGYVDYDKVDYVVYLNDGPDDEYREIATVGAERTYTYTMEAGAQLRTVKIRVLPRNAAGISDDTTAWIDQDRVYVSDMLGTPYALPAIERFDNQNIKYTPLTIQRPDDYAGRWMISDPSGAVPDDNQSALMAYSPFDEGATMGRVAFPKFSTKGLGNVALTMKVMRYSSYAGEMSVYACSYTEGLTLLGTINCAAGTDWVEVSYPLPAQFQGKDWAQFVVDVDLADVDYVYAIDSYQISVSAATDLAVLEVATDAPLAAGTPAKVSARIANLGFNAVAPTVRFSAETPDGEVIATQDVNVPSVALGAETVAEWAFTPLAEHIDKELTVKAELVTPDEVPSNNAFAAKFHVRRPELPVVTTLFADSKGDGVVLTWDEPALNKTVTESFETLEDFYYGAEMGAFTAFDGDGKSVYKFQNQVMPNEQLPKAFMVVNANRVGEGLEAYAGDKYLLATCPEMLNGIKPDPANDWLISPEIVGGSYVSFYLNIISENYPETVRVMWSSTTDEPSAFAELTTVLKPRFGWQFLEFRLPADAKYFAINYVSQDMFGVMIDDVKFVSASDLHNVAKYNVYRDGALLGSTADRSFTDNSVTRGVKYTYHVTSVTDSESVKSNAATIVAGESALEAVTAAKGTATAIPGGIRVAGADSVCVYSLSGVLLYQATLGGTTVDVPLQPGLYIVSLDGQTVKLPVR